MNLGALEITSDAFDHDGAIPKRHTGEGKDVSPALGWSAIPSGTRQLALICHDPDAPLTHGFTHWVVYGIPATATELPEGGAGDWTHGRNDFGNEHYNGPMPPPGHGTHHYFFHLYALDTELDEGPGLTSDELLDAIDDHIIEQARVVGTYQR